MGPIRIFLTLLIRFEVLSRASPQGGTCVQSLEPQNTPQVQSFPEQPSGSPTKPPRYLESRQARMPVLDSIAEVRILRSERVACTA
jgi:hypothetical protein